MGDTSYPSWSYGSGRLGQLRYCDRWLQLGRRVSARAAFKYSQNTAVEFERNFIRTVVCELRFPTLLEIEQRDPVGLQHALRAEFPFYEKQHSVSPRVCRLQIYDTSSVPKQRTGL